MTLEGIGTIAGGTGGYWIGRTGGMAVIRRQGRWLGINKKWERSARAFFDKHGAKTIIIARLIALLRMIAGIMAGSVEMPFGLFSLCNTIGGLIWPVASGSAVTVTTLLRRRSSRRGVPIFSAGC